MYTVSIAETKAHFSEILNQVIAGEEIVITRRGQPIAKIGAIKKLLKSLPNLEKFRSSFPPTPVSSMQVLHELRDVGTF
jgi:prevent-host-death family protein